MPPDMQVENNAGESRDEDLNDEALDRTTARLITLAVPMTMNDRP